MVYIRSAHLDDVCSIQTLVGAAINEMGQYSQEAKEKEISYCTKETIEESINDNLCVAAEVNGNIVGVCFGTNEDGPIWLNWIVVNPFYQKRGYGQLLLQQFLILAAQKGSKVWCSVLTSNTSSNCLMDQYNFIFLTELTNHWHGLDFNLWQKIF